MTSRNKGTVGTKRCIKVGGQSLYTLFSPTVSEKGSVFQSAAIWPLSSEKQAVKALAALCLDTKFAGATCRMTGYRIVDPGKKGRIYKAYNDDGELNGGQRLLGTLTKEKVVNVGVVVVRWYGGVHIGPARFTHIVDRTRYILTAIGHKPGIGVQHVWGAGITQFLGRQGDGKTELSEVPDAKVTKMDGGRVRDMVNVTSNDISDAVQHKKIDRDSAVADRHVRDNTPTTVGIRCSQSDEDSSGQKKRLLTPNETDKSNRKRSNTDANVTPREESMRIAIATAAEKRLRLSSSPKQVSHAVQSGSNAGIMNTNPIIID